MSRSMRPRLGRTQLRKTSSPSLLPEQELPSSPVGESGIAPVTPPEVIRANTPQLSFAPEQVVQAQIIPEQVVEEQRVPEPRVEDRASAIAAIADQPTGAIPPTPVVPHPELDVPPETEAAELAPTRTTTGSIPVWALETIPMFAPRPMPQVEEGKSKDTPLELMLRDLRVRKPKVFNMLRTSTRSALASIWLNRLTSSLTTLSIVIGIAAVIVTLVLVQGAGAYFIDVLVGLGNSSIVIDAGTYNNGWDMTSQPVRTLSQRDVLELSKVQHVEAISPVINLDQQVGFDSQNWDINVQGVSPSIEDMQGWQMESGMWLSQSDDAGVRQVAVLGSDTAQKFMNESGLDPLGENITIGSQSYKIIGILAPQGGYRLDDVVFIPTNTALLRINGVRGIDRIEIKLDNTTDSYLTIKQMVNILRKNHKLAVGGPNDFQINATQDLIALTQQEMQAMNILLIGTAIILLVAGGIGIINIMLASVTRRTREIGVRIAVGARRSDIRNQFLIEALVLSLGGGGLGMLAGLGVGYELMKFINAPFIVSSVTFVMPFAIALFIGIVFGLYPAIRAARLEPVVALQGS